jgi:hypothetical protein
MFHIKNKITLEANIKGHPLWKTNMFNHVRMKYKQIQTLLCSKLFTFFNAYSAQFFI